MSEGGARRGRLRARGRARGLGGGRGDHAAASAEVGARRQRLPPRRLACELRRQWRGCVVRLRAGQAAADARRRWRSSCTATTSSPATTQMYELIRHTVRKGNIVIYPRWQTGIAVPCPGPFDIEPCMTSAVNGIRGALSLPAGEAEATRAAAISARPATSASRSAASSPRTSRTGTGRCTCRSRGRSSSTTRTTAASTGSTSPRWTTRCRASPRPSSSSATRAPTGVISEPNKANGELQRDLSEACAHPEAEQGPRADPHRRARRSRTCPPATACAAGGRARPTPTTGTSAGRSGTRFGAVPTSGATAATRWATPAGIARTAGGATGCRSPRSRSANGVRLDRVTTATVALEGSRRQRQRADLRGARRGRMVDRRRPSAPAHARYGDAGLRPRGVRGRRAAAYVAVVERGRVVQAFRSVGLAGVAVALCVATASGSFIAALNHTSVARVLFILAVWRRCSPPCSPA